MKTASSARLPRTISSASPDAGPGAGAVSASPLGSPDARRGPAGGGQDDLLGQWEQDAGHFRHRFVAHGAVDEPHRRRRRSARCSAPGTRAGGIVRAVQDDLRGSRPFERPASGLADALANASGGVPSASSAVSAMSAFSTWCSPASGHSMRTLAGHTPGSGSRSDPTPGRAPAARSSQRLDPSSRARLDGRLGFRLCAPNTAGTPRFRIPAFSAQ